MATPQPTLARGTGELAAELRSFRPLGLLAIAVIFLSGNVFVGNYAIPLGAMLVLLWVKLSGTPWRAMGYVRPRNWPAAVGFGVVLGVALKLAMKAILLPLLGADPVNHAVHHWVGNRALLPSAAWSMLVAGFGEKTVFRGFAFQRLGKILGAGATAKGAIVLLTSAAFGLAHYAGQGVSGREQAFMVGLTFGTIFAFTGRIWLLMCAHAAFDLVALAIIYWDLETRVAHLVVR